MRKYSKKAQELFQGAGSTTISKVVGNLFQTPSLLAPLTSKI